MLITLLQSLNCFQELISNYNLLQKIPHLDRLHLKHLTDLFLGLLIAPKMKQILKQQNKNNRQGHYSSKSTTPSGIYNLTRGFISLIPLHRDV